ncbi:MAG: leucine-rich repeat domain-containing protein, partial [Bacilli bacterium]|nr:leucine-rich repeat domain-containing protein [Bacilli bacterium]
IVSLAIVLALVFGISYAYFLAQDESGTQTITTQDLGLVLDDGQNKQPVLLAENIKPIDRADIQTKAVKKNFTVENTGSEKLFVEITLDELVLGTNDALKRFDFLWALYEVNGETEKNISIGSFENAEDTVTVGKYEVLDADETKEYNLYIWIEETNLNQNVMMGQEFSAKVVATGEVYWESPASDFTFNSGIITNNGTSTEISIPTTINDVAVTEIGMMGFLSGGLTNLIIPRGVNTIQDMAFNDNQLTSIVIPNSLTILYGFGDNQLTSVIIPNSVTEIGSGAFQNNQLTSIVIPEGVTEIGSRAFYNNKITSIIIPSSVTSIGMDAFANNSLTNIIVEGKDSLSDFTGENYAFGLQNFEDIITFKP